LREAIYPGSFDPITKGHIDIINRSSEIFDKIIVTISINPEKDAFFSIEEKLDMAKKSVSHLENVEVVSFDGLLTDYVVLRDVNIIIKGLRAVSDFEYEFQMALMNRVLNDKVETLFMMTKSEFSFLSSSLVKEVARLGGNIENFVTEYVNKKILEKLEDVKTK